MLLENNLVLWNSRAKVRLVPSSGIIIVVVDGSHLVRVESSGDSGGTLEFALVVSTSAIGK